MPVLILNFKNIILLSINIMKNTKKTVTYWNRYLGIVFLVFFQILIGVIHIFFGTVLFLSEFFEVPAMISSLVYSIYTIFYGAFTLIFTYFLWQKQKVGWKGIIAISIFVLAVDFLTLFNLLSVLGIPKFAPFFEIPYCILIIIYLLQDHVRNNFFNVARST
jgi:hypothetical protein